MSSSSKTPLSLLEGKGKDEKAPRKYFFIGTKRTLVLFDVTFQKTNKETHKRSIEGNKLGSCIEREGSLNSN